MKYSVVNVALGWLTFIISLITYTLTLEPTVSFWDCGEFISASYRLQICHPPGAPLFLMIGRIFSLMASDVAHVAFWVNMVSATTSALCVMFFFWTITHLAKKALTSNGDEMSMAQTIGTFGAGLVGALTLTFSDTFWFSAVEAEVYASSSFFTTLTFWCILKWENIANEKDADRWLILIAYLIGLAIGVHLLNLLVIPAIVYVYYFKKYSYTRNGFLKATGVAVLAIGVVQFFIIPGLPSLATKLDYFAVNSLGMNYNTGFVFLIILLSTVVSATLYYTHTSNKISLYLAIAAYAIMVVSSFIVNPSTTTFILWAVLSVILYFVVLKERASKAVLNFYLLLFTFVVIGYSSYAMIVIRSLANPPIDMNDPEQPFSLLSYLNREQYGDNPLVYGQYYFARPIDYKKTGINFRKTTNADGAAEYVEAGPKLEPQYDKKDCTIFPRMWADRADYVQSYQDWENISKTATRIPFSKNIDFLLSYQLRFMYWRYFMWNFSGRQNDEQGYGDHTKGNWITGITFIDNMLLGPQKDIPDSIKNSRARNTYFLLPLLLGILGFIYHYRKAKQDMIVVLTLFLFTGFFIILYLNFPAHQPRERDYAYVGSYQTFIIWIGLGVLAIIDFITKRKENAAMSAVVSLACLGSPILMGQQNWDDHDRSGRATALHFAEDYLNSCAKDAILFTNGDNDTYPLWYAQNVEGIRSDIRVINLSLLNTDWYADGLKRQAYDSKPIYFSMSSDLYAQGTRDYVVHYDGPDVMGKYGLNKNDYYDFKAVMKEFICSNDPGKIVTAGGGTKLNFYPVNRFSIKVDKEACLKNGVVSPEDAPYMVDSIKFELGGSNMMKAELVLLDIVANNLNTRPIYWAITTGTEAYSNLQGYFQLEGLTYRIVPIAVGQNNDPTGSFGRINSNILYDNLMHKFKFGNIENPGVHLDETILRQTKNLRNLYYRLAEKLVQEGKQDSAHKVLDYCQKVLPVTTIPPDYFSCRLAEGYLLAGDSTEAQRILREVVKLSEEKANYYRTFVGTKKLKGVKNEWEEAVQLISICGNTAYRYKQEKLLSEVDSVYNRVSVGLPQ